MTKVAIIDDQDLVCSAFAAILETQGYTTVCFSRGEDFFAQCDLGSLDCIVLDLRLPGMSGVDVFLRILRLGHSIPALLISGNLDDEVLKPIRENPLVVTLRKPCSADKIISTIQELIQLDTDQLLDGMQWQ